MHVYVGFYIVSEYTSRQACSELETNGIKPLYNAVISSGHTSPAKGDATERLMCTRKVVCPVGFEPTTR